MSSSFNDEIYENSWISLADKLLPPRGKDKSKISVALMKKIIEIEGIRTHDQWGALIEATDGGEDEPNSKNYVYKLLALYYAELRELDDLPPGQHPNHDPYRWLEYGSPLCKFGWPKDEAPSFKEWIRKSHQKKILPEGSSSGCIDPSIGQTKTTDQDKPWLVKDPRDPEPEQPWYTPARYFARKLARDDSTLLTKRDTLAKKVVQSLTNIGIKKRGGKKSFNPGTIKKAFSNVSLD